MSRQLEQAIEQRSRKRHSGVVRAIYGGLAAAIQEEGYELLGFSCRLSGGDCLLTLRAENGAGKVVCFVGGEDLPESILKADREARGGQLRWRADKYAK